MVHYVLLLVLMVRLFNMEELYTIASLSLLYRSRTLTHLQVELYNFDDRLLSTLHLSSQASLAIRLQVPLKNFYIRLINTDHQICELFSYFWVQGVAKQETVNLVQTYDNFIIEIGIEIQRRQDGKQPSSDTVDGAQLEIDPKEYLKGIKQRVFDVLSGQGFFAEENSHVKCNFVRKNKTHKNLTALLIKNSTNILRSINENVRCTTVKTYNQLKTTQANQTAEEIAVEELPVLPIMKKTNSVQDNNQNWHRTDSHQTIIPPESSKEPERSLPIQMQQDAPPKPAAKPKMKKIRFFVREKKEVFERKLLDETMTDLKNQRQTLSIIQSYIDNFPSSPKRQTAQPRRGTRRH